MKLTNKHGNYAKRIKPLSRTLQTYLDVPEHVIIEAVTVIAPLVRYFKSNSIFLTLKNNTIDADTKQFEGVYNIVLHTYIEDDVVCCDDYITLLFPPIED